MGEPADLERLRIDRAPRRARRGGFPWGWLLFLAWAVATGWFFRAPLLSFADRVRLPEVAVQRAVRTSPIAASAVRGTAANGYIVARRRAALSADTPGRIVEMNVEEGTAVKRGEVVARLFFDEAEAALAQAEANLGAGEAALQRAETEVEAARARAAERQRTVESAEASLQAERAAADLAELRAVRASELLEAGVGNQDEVDRTRADRVASNARVGAAAAVLERARAEAATAEREVGVSKARATEARVAIRGLEAARDRSAAVLSNTYVRAPFDGIVVLKDAEIGEVVSPNSQGAQSRGSVATLVDFASLEAQVEVPESNLASVRQDGRAEVFLDAFPERGYAGRVTRIWPTANRQKATVEVRVALDELDERLRPEMGVRVVFLPEDAAPADASEEQPALADVILVPGEALVAIEGERGVFVVERDTVAFRPLELGERRGERVVVVGGLDEGETFVVAPPANLNPGDRVRVTG